MVLKFEPVKVMKPFKLVEHLAEAASIAVHPKGKIYATGGLDDRVLIWDYSTGSRKKVIRGFGGMALSLAFHEDGSLFVGGNGSILRIDVETGETLSKFTGLKGFVYSICVFSDFLMSGGQDGRVRCWGLDGEKIWEKQIDVGSVHCLTKLPDSSLLIVGERPHFHVLDIQGNLISEIPAHRDSISSLAVHPGGVLVATGSDDGSVSIWKNGLWYSLKHFNCEAPVTSLAFSPKHSLLAVGRKYENAILLDWSKPKENFSDISDSQGVTSFVWSSTGNTLFGTLSNGTVLGWGKKPKLKIEKKKEKKKSSKKVEFLTEKPIKEVKGNPFKVFTGNKIFKNKPILISVIVVIILVFSKLFQDPNMPPKKKIRETRVYIEEESWARASSSLVELNQGWPESADVSDLLARYEQEAFISLKRKIESFVDSQNFKESIIELEKIPKKPNLDWVSLLLKKSYRERLLQIQENNFFNPYIDNGSEFLNEAILISGKLNIQNPSWISDAEQVLELEKNIPFGEGFKNGLREFLKNSSILEVRAFSEKVFYLEIDNQDQELILSALHRYAATDGLPVFKTSLPSELKINTILSDSGDLIIGTKGGTKRFSFSGREKFLWDVKIDTESSIEKMNLDFYASSDGGWASPDWKKVISKGRYFDEFDVAGERFGVFHERETRSLQFIDLSTYKQFKWDGLESRQVKLSINKEGYVAVGYNFGPNNSIVSVYKPMSGEVSGLSAVGNLTINQPIVDVVIADSGTLFVFDQTGQIWTGDASESFPKAVKILSDPNSLKLGTLTKDGNDDFAFATEFTNEIFVFSSEGIQLKRISWDPSFGKVWSLGFFRKGANRMLAVGSEDKLVFFSLEVHSG